jgi:hypothetical protein
MKELFFPYTPYKDDEIMNEKYLNETTIKQKGGKKESNKKLDNIIQKEFIKNYFKE